MLIQIYYSTIPLVINLGAYGFVSNNQGVHWAVLSGGSKEESTSIFFQVFDQILLLAVVGLRSLKFLAGCQLGASLRS